MGIPKLPSCNLPSFFQVSKQDESSGDTVPKFYKKDLMMIIQERNELKEKVAALAEELASLKT